MKLYEKIVATELSTEQVQKGLEMELILTDALLYNVYSRFGASMTADEWTAIAKALTCVRIVQSHPDLTLEYRARGEQEETRLRDALQQHKDVI